MKTPEQYYNSLSDTEANSPIDKNKEFKFSSFDLINFTKAYLKDVILPEIKQRELIN